MITRPKARMMADLALIVAAINDVDVKLFQNDMTPTEDSGLADFTEADFSGYAASAGAQLSAPYPNEQGLPESNTGLLNYTHSTGLVNNTIYGYYGVNTGVLQFAQRFSEPVEMAAASTPLMFVAKYILPLPEGEAVIIT